MILKDGIVVSYTLRNACGPFAAGTRVKAVRKDGYLFFSRMKVSTCVRGHLWFLHRIETLTKKDQNECLEKMVTKLYDAALFLAA